MIIRTLELDRQHPFRSFEGLPRQVCPLEPDDLGNYCCMLFSEMPNSLDPVSESLGVSARSAAVGESSSAASVEVSVSSSSNPQQPHDGARREELPAELTLCLRELGKEVLIDAAEGIACLRPIPFEADVRDKVDQPLHLLRRNAAPGVIARELALEVRVVALNREDGVIDQRGDVGAGSLVLQVLPPGLGWHPEDPLGGVLVAVSRAGRRAGGR